MPSLAHGHARLFRPLIPVPSTRSSTHTDEAWLQTTLTHSTQNRVSCQTLPALQLAETTLSLPLRQHHHSITLSLCLSLRASQSEPSPCLLTVSATQHGRCRDAPASARQAPHTAPWPHAPNTSSARCRGHQDKKHRRNTKETPKKHRAASEPG